jgi:hypothetical protein
MIGIYVYKSNRELTSVQSLIERSSYSSTLFKFQLVQSFFNSIVDIILVWINREL